MNYNNKFPTFSFRIERYQDQKITKLASQEKKSRTEFAENKQKEWEQKSQNPQSPYDAKNKRLQCVDCGQLFTWENYEMYNIAIQEFQRHLVAKHNRVKTEIEKDVLLNLSYEGASE